MKFLGNIRELLRLSFHGSALPCSFWWSVRGGFLLILGLAVFSACTLLLLGPHEFEQVLVLQLGLIYCFATLLFLFHWPQAGFVLLLFAAIMISREIGTGRQVGLNGAFLLSPVLIGIWLIHLVFRRYEHNHVSSRSILPLYLFMLTAVLAFMVGQYPWFPAPHASISAQLVQLAIFLFSGGLFLVAAYQLQDMRWLARVSYFFIGLGSIHLLFRLLPLSLANFGSILPQAMNSASMFWTWLVAMSFGQALLNYDLHPFKRLLLGAVALTAIGIGLTQMGTWLSGWGPALLAVFIILLIRFPFPFLLATPVVGIIALLSASYLMSFLAGGDNIYSFETRIAAMKSLLPILSANPLLGVGPANYFHYTPLNPILGWYVQFNSHNNYLDLIAQIGIVGLAFFLWFAWAVCRTAWKLRSKLTGGFETAYTYSVLAGLVASLAAAALGDWLLPFIYNTGLAGYRTSILPWVFMGGLVATEQQLVRRT